MGIIRRIQNIHFLRKYKRLFVLQMNDNSKFIVYFKSNPESLLNLPLRECLS